MNIIILILSITVMSSYIILVSEQNRLILDTINYVYKSKKQYYELEAALYYAIYYFKENKNDLSLPFNLKFEQFNELKNLNINFTYAQEEKVNVNKIIINVKANYNNIKSTKSCTLKIIEDKVKILAIK